MKLKVIVLHFLSISVFACKAFIHFSKIESEKCAFFFERSTIYAWFGNDHCNDTSELSKLSSLMQ